MKSYGEQAPDDKQNLIRKVHSVFCSGELKETIPPIRLVCTGAIQNMTQRLKTSKKKVRSNYYTLVNQSNTNPLDNEGVIS